MKTKYDVRIKTTTLLYGRPQSGEVSPVPVIAELRFSLAEPCAFTIAFRVLKGSWVEWTFARELVADAVVHSRAGVGDVRFDHHPLWDDRLWLVLESPSGHAQFDVSRDDLINALVMSELLVPIGDEQLDAEMDAWLADVRKAA